MKFSTEKKKSIQHYILEKIDQREASVSKKASEAYAVNQATIHDYINELIENGAIYKVKRGEYKLARQQWNYTIERERGDLDSDTKAYNMCMREHISDLTENIQRIWTYVFCEMINNVMDHSAASEAQIVIIRDALKTTAAITDNGIGIFKKIMDHFKLPTIDDAIIELFKGKLTTDAENHSGEGIFFSSRILDSYAIISDGKIYTNNRFDVELTDEYSDKDFQGTRVIMELSNTSAKSLKDLFDQYSDANGAFTKTRIPLKNMFDSFPVSRSQAKRLCERLGSFEEVILDFEGTDFIGQGFAHQIFHVFARSNPSIKITPINMNEDIRKMIYHVSQ